MLDVRFNQQLTVDPKGRLTLPVRLRNALLDQARTNRLVFIVYNEHLRAYTHADFLTAVEARFGALDGFSDEQEATQRRVLGMVNEVDVDDAGRFILPAHVREIVGIERDVIAISLADRLELWDARRFAAWWAAHGTSGGARA